VLAEGREREGEPSKPVDAARASELRDAAFAHFARAIDLGWTGLEAVEQDPDLAELRTDPRWKELLGRAHR
jgi:hypothetical protein